MRPASSGSLPDHQQIFEHDAEGYDASATHPGLSQTIAAAERGDITKVIFEDLTKLCRDEAELRAIWRRLERLGVSVEHFPTTLH